MSRPAWFEPSEAAYAALQHLLRLWSALNGKTNAELSKMLGEHIYNQLPANSPYAALISEVCERLDADPLRVGNVKDQDDAR